MNNVYIGWDNGSTGSIGILATDIPGVFIPTPIKKVPNYQKATQYISRLDLLAIKKFFQQFTPDPKLSTATHLVRCLLERPFMAPMMTINYKEFVDEKGLIECEGKEMMQFIDTKKTIPTANVLLLKASLNAHRSYEASVILLESMGIGNDTVDSKAWQKNLLGTGIKGSKQLKEASKLKGIQLYPHLESVIRKHGDADGLLIAEFARRYYNQ